MHGPYPGELRLRVIDFVEGGGSRRGAAEPFEVSVSSAIRWVQHFREDGTCEPMPRGGSTSPLEKRFSHLSAPNRTSRWMRLFRRFASGKSGEVVVRCPASSLAMASLSKKVCGRQSASAPPWLARAGAGFGRRRSVGGLCRAAFGSMAPPYFSTVSSRH
jgi:hypothetical protein